MKKLGERSVALAITSTLILSSFFVIGGNTLIEMRENVKLVFQEGTPVNPMSIQQQIGIMIGQASNMLVVSERYLEEDHELVQSFRLARNNLANAETPKEKYYFKTDLLEEIYRMNSFKDELGMSEADNQYFIEILENIESSRRIIRNNKYNIIAADFNDQLRRFPANIISFVRGVEAVYIYG